MLCESRGCTDMTPHVQAIFDILASFPLSIEGAVWIHNYESLQPLEPHEGQQGFLNLYNRETFSLGSDCHYDEDPMDPNVMAELHAVAARLERQSNPVEDAQRFIGGFADELHVEDPEIHQRISAMESSLRRLPVEIVSDILLYLPSASVRNLQLADPFFNGSQGFRHENEKLLRGSESDIRKDEAFWQNAANYKRLSLCKVPNVTSLVDQVVELPRHTRHASFSFVTLANERYISGIRIRGVNNWEKTLGYFRPEEHSSSTCSHQTLTGESITGFDIALDNGFKLIGIAICSTSDSWPSDSQHEGFALEDRHVDRLVVPEKEIWYPELPPLGLKYVLLNKLGRPPEQPYHYCIFGGARGERLQNLNKVIITADKHVRSIAFQFGSDGEEMEQAEFTRPRYGLKPGENLATTSLAIDGARGERITRVEGIRDPCTELLTSLQIFTNKGRAIRSQNTHSPDGPTRDGEIDSYDIITTGPSEAETDIIGFFGTMMAHTSQGGISSLGLVCV
ncbi:Mannose-binding lectin [Metarhizium album ARSEF 1941]|uniref:Mannose-binding lectin n=1 Tax=Metarhizium album (strain ARSEF 1941) TaxID=1081103 RepID=A0A0B2WKG2_METAS|nr:Mannose-binding lectin [Metarhizium album ARSEF 1941]KHN93967.1 Mannose-binding lectin [Metarhizium album ARSEF 1941]